MIMPKVHLVKYALVLITFMVVLTGCPEKTPITPIPQFTYSPSKGMAPLVVRFEDTSIPGVGPIHSWAWDFGDGGTNNRPSPEYVYKEPGVYTVKLVITTSEGLFSIVKKDAITVEEPGVFGEPDGNNTFTGNGVSITLPAAYNAQIVFGVRRNAEQVALDAFGPLEIVSDVFTLLHNQDDPDLFVYNAAGRVDPTTLSIPLLQPLPPSVGPLNVAQLFVRVEDGRIVPIPGEVRSNRFVASVARLPKRAEYIVARRADMIVRDLGGKQAGIPGGKNWEQFLTLYSCPLTRQMVTAVFQGSNTDEDSFRRTDFASSIVNQAMNLLGNFMENSVDDLARSGLLAPTLVVQNGAYTINLFNMSPSYPNDFERVSDVTYYDHFFGHLVVDPAQLVAIAIRNVRIAAEDEDALDGLDRLYPQSAFTEALMQSVYPGYDIPFIATTGNTALGLPIPADETLSGKTKAVSFIRGFQDGAAIYAGRRAQDYKARNFGDSELGVLSWPALFPYSPYIPGYGNAGQEFFAWLDNSNFVADPLPLIAYTLEDLNTELSDIASRYRRPLNFNEATGALYRALNRAFQVNPFSILPSFEETYWEFLKDYAYLNGPAAVLRPADILRTPLSFNEDRFAEDATIHVTFEGPDVELTLSSENNEKLKGIAPFASRAIVFNLHPMTGEMLLSVNSDLWNLESGYVPRVAVYQEGQEGAEFFRGAKETKGYTFVDTNDDGHIDSIRINDLGCLGTPCSNRVIVLITNTLCEQPCDFELSVEAYADAPVQEDAYLSRYVHAYEPLYEYEVAQVLDNSASDGFVAYVLGMTSGAWRGANEVYETVWSHDLVVIEPNNVNQSTGMLFISGGSMDTKAFSSSDLKTLEELAIMARASRSVVALLTLVPNQPLSFVDEVQGRSEDEILAYSFNKYMNTYDAGDTDLSWPALLPMTRAAVKALDTVQDFMLNKPGRVRTVDKFVVAGASKRGWTTWLTAAADERVSAIIPMVIDVLNMAQQMEHHRNVYSSYPFNSAQNFIFNGYSTAVRDYVELGVFERFDDPAGESLLRIVDPYRYRNLLDMPKLLANSTGDQFFPPDASRFFYDDLPGVNYLHYAPNTDHSLVDGLDVDADTLNSIRAFYIAQVLGTPIPSYTWDYNPETTEITVQTDVTPTEVLFWSANALSHRDFRLQRLGQAWSSREVVASEDGAYRDTIGVPAPGWRGGLMQIRFAGPAEEADFVFTTPVWITPDVYAD